jgi:diguanylate cyclase (GGDEF)-like protein/PAS domain S-box-containing protein
LKPLTRSNDEPRILGTKAVKEKHQCQLLDIALATVVDAVIGTDAHDHITCFNPAAESMTGWRSSEALGKPLTQVFFLIDQENDRVIDTPLDRVKHGPAETAGMTHAAVVNRRGLQVEIEYTAVAMHDAHGRFAGAVIVSRARRQTAEIALQTTNESLLANADALFEEKERAQVTLDSIGDAVISTNFSGRVSYLNVVAEKMTGWVQLDASASAVDEIFRLVDATTHETIPCPTAQAIIENRRISLEAGCVLIRRDGEEIAVEVSAAPIHDRHGGVIGAVMVAHDVTAARELSMKLARMALHDSLTDLPNRTLFSDRLSQATTNAHANDGYAALLYVDLDRFKHINDSLGHAIGDKLLQTVARRLLGCVRSTDTVSRQGGDEFVVLLPDIVHINDAVTCAEKVLGALEAPYQIGEHELRLSASIGVAIFPDDAKEAEALLRCADFAMYQAKYHGRNNYKLFNPASELDFLE